MNTLRKLFTATRDCVVDAVIARAMRTPYAHIGDYMERYWLLQPSKWTFGIGVRVHHILRSDQDRALHTHPWWFVSLILRGVYWEVTPAPAGSRGADHGGYVNVQEPIFFCPRKAGSIAFRARASRHKLVLLRGPVWTLVITGPDHGEWGFHVPGEGHVDRHEYEERGVQL
jgi:hypothetical protein